MVELSAAKNIKTLFHIKTRYFMTGPMDHRPASGPSLILGQIDPAVARGSRRASRKVRRLVTGRYVHEPPMGSAFRRVAGLSDRSKYCASASAASAASRLEDDVRDVAPVFRPCHIFAHIAHYVDDDVVPPVAGGNPILEVPVDRYIRQIKPTYCADAKFCCTFRDESADMFYHGYNAYMANAYPADELMPLSCRGRFRGIEPDRGDIDESMGK